MKEQELDIDGPASALTVREYIAVHAMAAIISKQPPCGTGGFAETVGVKGFSQNEAKEVMEAIAHGAVRYADCLIAELQQTE